MFAIMCVVTFLELLVASLMLAFFMPKFAEIFRDFGEPVPWVARQVMWFSQLLDAGGWFIATPLLILSVGLVTRAGLNPAHRRTVTLGLIAFSALLVTVVVFTSAGLLLGLDENIAALEGGTVATR